MADSTPKTAAGQRPLRRRLGAFGAEDFGAGTTVVLLMLGIFSMGVALYSVVVYLVTY